MVDGEITKPTCWNCAYQMHGRCHRYPPQRILYDGGIDTDFPIVNLPDAWCGEWKELTPP